MKRSERVRPAARQYANIRRKPAARDSHWVQLETNGPATECDRSLFAGRRILTGGGSTADNLNTRERDLEVDDDIVLTHSKQMLKIGLQSLTVFLHNYDPDTFHGAFVFRGGSAPLLDGNGKPTGQTTTIDGLEQYRHTV
jgi:hypothetical protein